MGNFKCRICGKQFDRIPSDAIQIGRGSVSPLYRFADGSVHSIGSTKLGRRKNAVKPAKEKEA
jgi:hypothetical protein